MEILPIIDYASILISLFFFALSSVYDFKTREVTDKAWLLYGPLGLVLTVARLFQDPSELFLTIISIVITISISFGLFYFGLFGGADAKAIMCLGLTIPIPPSSFQPLMGYLHPVFPVVVVMVGFICSASVALWFGFRNLLAYVSEGPKMFAGFEHESSWKKLTATITGYPVDMLKLRSTFYLYPIEELVQNSEGTHRSFKLFFSAEADRDQMVSKLVDSFSAMGFQGRVWVTPGLPMLLFILLGLVITLALGDPVFSTVLRLAVR